jgi:hypothetical protein
MARVAAIRRPRPQMVTRLPVSARRAGADVPYPEVTAADPDDMPTRISVLTDGLGLLGSCVDVGVEVTLGEGDGDGDCVAGVVVVGVGAGDVGAGSVATGVDVDDVPPRQMYGSDEFSPGIPSSCR